MERPAFHALLNGTAAVLLTLGWMAITARGPWRAGRSEHWHVRLMLAALAVSAVFLASYVDYHAAVGQVPFWGSGALALLYRVILVPHVILATLMVPLIAVTVVLAARGRLEKHRRLARWTLPIWWYVSASGVAVWVLNHALRPVTA